MIRVEMMQTDKGYSVAASGHAGYAPKGQDIVCAAVSVLLQTLANKVEDAARQGQLLSSCVQHGETFAVQAQPHGGMNEIMVAAWYDFVEEGLSELAGQYPEHVELYICDDSDGSDMPEKALNLQKFADGAAAGGDGGAGAEGAGETAPVQAPALRPAQERLAKRSHAGRAAKAAGTGTQAESTPAAPGAAAADNTPPDRDGRNEAGPGEAEPEGEGKEAGEQAPPTAQQRRSAFAQAMQQYPEEFEEAMQRAAQIAVQNIRQNPQLNELGQALADAYGVDMSDMAGLIDAVKNGRVKNDEYYETMAQQRGISVKTAREMDRMEGELQRANAEKQRAQQMRLAAEHQQRAAAVRAQWEAEAAQLKNSYPDFELDEVLANPAVADMIRRGVSLEAAYRAAYFDQLMENRTALTAKQVEQGVAARIQQRGARPAENGTHPGGAAEMKVDVAHMTKAQREELARRARRGERIVL